MKEVNSNLKLTIDSLNAKIDEDGLYIQELYKNLNYFKLKLKA